MLKSHQRGLTRQSHSPYSVTFRFAHPFGERCQKKSTDKETTLPAVSGPFGTRGGSHRLPLNRVQISGN